MRLLNNIQNYVKYFHKISPSKTCTLERVSGHEGIYAIALNRPAAKNALNKEMINQLQEYFLEISNIADANLLIIRSNVSKIFCAGADLKERSNMPLNEVGPHVTKLRNLFQMLYDIPITTIAAIDGVAFGGGLEMCLACDLRIAATHAKMGLVETTLGIIPGAGGTQRLPRLIGISRAKEFILTGSIIDAERALQIGLVNEVASNISHNTNKSLSDNNSTDASLFPAYYHALNLAKDINERCAPLSLKYAKEAINNGIEKDLINGLNIEELAYNKIIKTEDRNEGIKAF